MRELRKNKIYSTTSCRNSISGIPQKCVFDVPAKSTARALGRIIAFGTRRDLVAALRENT